MIARPPHVGQRLYLICALVGLAMAASAVEPARIGEIKFLRDGTSEKIRLDYQGNLRYREYQFPRARYGYIDFEPAVCKDPKLRVSPHGAWVKELKVNPQGTSDRPRVRLLYDMERWTAPTLHDSGASLEIRFAPATAPASSGATPESDSGEGIAASPPPFSNPNDDLFGSYLKLSTQKPLASTIESAPSAASSKDTNPEPRVSSLPRRARSETIAAPLPIAPYLPETRRVVASAMMAQGGEGTPPAAVPVASADPPATPTVQVGASPGPVTTGGMTITPILTPPTPPAESAPATTGVLGKYQIIKHTKAMLPETTPLAGRIMGGRGYEFVDLTQGPFQKQVSLTFKDADLQNAIRILARYADMNVVMDPAQVKGRVTIELNNVPVGPALSSILRTNELELVREPGGIYRVVPSRLVRPRPQREEVTVLIPLNWVTAGGVKAILDPVTEGRIGVDVPGNSLVITDTPLMIEEIANIVQRIDKPEKQVMLEARLVEMNTVLSRSMGITWDFSTLDDDFSEGLIPNGVTPDPSQTNPLSFDRRVLPGLGTAALNSVSVAEPLNANHGLRLALGKEFGSYQLSMLIEAAETADLAKTLAAPRVVTVNNQPAKIEIVRQIPYSSTVIGAGGAQSVTFSYEKVGIEMMITPNITNNDYVRMNIQPTQRILIGRPAGNLLARPIIDERISQTNVIVKDEDTAVIAGLRQQAFTDGASGTPWMMKIPVLSWLFKQKSYGDNKLDLMAFVTPHIIKEAYMLTENDKERYNEIDVQWDLPDYFYDDVRFDESRKP